MNINLPDSLAEYVQDQVRNGRFQNVDEVIEQAVRLMYDMDLRPPGDKEELQRLIDEGLRASEEGRVSDWDVEEFKATLRKRLEKKKKAS